MRRARLSGRSKTFLALVIALGPLLMAIPISMFIFHESTIDAILASMYFAVVMIPMSFVLVFVVYKE